MKIMCLHCHRYDDVHRSDLLHASSHICITNCELLHLNPSKPSSVKFQTLRGFMHIIIYIPSGASHHMNINIFQSTENGTGPARSNHAFSTECTSRASSLHRPWFMVLIPWMEWRSWRHEDFERLVSHTCLNLCCCRKHYGILTSFSLAKQVLLSVIILWQQHQP